MEQVKLFRCSGKPEDAFDRTIEDLNVWLKEHSVEIIQRSVSSDGSGFPMVFIFYKQQ